METIQVHEIDVLNKNHDGKTKCNNCACWRIPEDFIGVKGTPVKRCKKCRDKDSKQKKKPETVLVRNERQREKQYYKVHREKKREEDEEAYLLHNAEIQKTWRQNNQERVSQWRTNNVNYRLKGIKQQAGIKRLTWCDTMTKEVCTKLMTNPCFYCDFLSTETVNGIDRMDNSTNYTISNCVSCCKRCNFMKTALDTNTFIKRCAHIALRHDGEGEIDNTIWKDSKCSTYKSYKTRAEKKNLSFELTKEMFDIITNNACVYCKKENTKTHRNGIDRAINSLGYTVENSRPCCGECNYMKGALNEVEFIDWCKRISTFTKDKHIPEMPQGLSCI
jgi:hypothetical protein